MGLCTALTICLQKEPPGAESPWEGPCLTTDALAGAAPGSPGPGFAHERRLLCA